MYRYKWRTIVAFALINNSSIVMYSNEKMLPAFVNILPCSCRSCMNSSIHVCVIVHNNLNLLCVRAYTLEGNDGEVVVMRKVATWCLKPKGRVEVILSLLSLAGMPGTLRYKKLHNLNPEEIVTAGSWLR